MEFLMNLKLLFAGALIAAATPSFAADLAPAPIEPIAPIAIPFNWGGFYVGADVGYSWSQTDTDFSGPTLAGAGIAPFSLSPDGDGVVGGVFVGYKAQFNQIVVGLEADIEAASNSGDDSIFLTPLGVTGTSSVDKNWQGSVRARLGYAIDNFLPYITGGVAFGDFDVKATVPGFGTASDSKTFTGWTLGAGMDYAFTPNLIGRLEYRYTDYGDDNVTAFGVTDKVAIKDSTVRVGIAYKF
jgi:outer membrane immunogenic protein